MATVFKSSLVDRADHPVEVEEVTNEARSNPSFDGHEHIYRVTDAAAGLDAIIAIHDTTLGPALGGTRIWPYATRDEALTDVLRLSKGMTMKAAMAKTPTGGGKAVIIADSRTDKTPDLLRAYGRAVDRLGGRFITGEDVGLSVEDADVIAGETDYLLGCTGRGGDPAPSTALGCYVGIKSAARHRMGFDDLSGLTIAIQGLGHVGRNLAELLWRDGAELIVTDINAKSVLEAEKLYNARSVDPDEIFDVEADVFAPCAMGGVINDDTLDRLKVKIVAGSANNQLLEPRHGEVLHERGVLYAPDYIINGGGLIALSLELTEDGFTWPRARGLVSEIGNTLDEVFEKAAEARNPPEQVADEVARARIDAARGGVSME